MQSTLFVTHVEYHKLPLQIMTLVGKVFSYKIHQSYVWEDAVNLQMKFYKTVITQWVNDYICSYFYIASHVLSNYSC